MKTSEIRLIIQIAATDDAFKLIPILKIEFLSMVI